MYNTLFHWRIQAGAGRRVTSHPPKKIGKILCPVYQKFSVLSVFRLKPDVKYKSVLSKSEWFYK